MMRQLNDKKVKALHEKWSAAIMMHFEDYAGAKQKLLIAQQLYPELDNISLMLIICEILMLASSFELSQIMSYILDLIHPTSTHSDAGYYFNDLVNSINGIKDEFPGAELAQKIVQQALNMFSDREKDFHHGADNGLISSYEILDGENAESASASESCRDVVIDDVQLEQSTLKELMVKDQEECPQQGFYNFEKERNIKMFEPGQIWAANYEADEIKNCRYAKINSNSGDVLSVTWLKPILVGADGRIWCNASLPVACGAFRQDPNTCHQVNAKVFSYKCSSICGSINDQIEIYPKRGEIWALYKNGIVNERTCNPEGLEGCKFELIEMLSDYSKCNGADFALLVKVDGFRNIFKRLTSGMSPAMFHISPNSFLFSHKIPAHRLTAEKDEALFELDQMALPNNLIQQIEKKLCDVQLQLEGEFFEYKKSAYDFAMDQVWAIRCGKNIMPRRYAVVNNVISNRKVCVTLLEPELIHNSENKWTQDLPVACGTFKHGKSNVILDLSQFSHLVKCMQCTIRLHYVIYPQKGEVWAMYKDWNRKWEHNDYEQCQYWMVEIMSDFSKEKGMEVAKLEEVHDCLTIFQRKQLFRSVFEAEMLSFSHQVQAYKVTGVESYGIPEDSWQLDPHAIPLPQQKSIMPAEVPDSSNNIGNEPIQEPNEDTAEANGVRVLRATRKPKYLKDYVTDATY